VCAEIFREAILKDQKHLNDGSNTNLQAQNSSI
jgi:hypothetical protein